MDISIEKGSLEYINDCEEALLNSELGRIYFSREGSARDAILEGLEQGNLYIALTNRDCVGFLYYIPKGAFHSFPYLHIISIKEEYRGKGIGKKLINFLEDMVFVKTNKIFLVVADFNPDAKGFYERIGYRQVGEIPSLYRKGITEYLMMKEKEE
ncbi:GNAT family N-acetyltransferase [Lutispora thermophila]|uniref:Acetyltransferase (GNAT) family protein n=1 Tax=Lutispora thermophila DSM 19022 TaxID=1122184 RepID=A0A1M6IF48_9FIRM|nr:N-acetyltransferase [Lutispora thermophila]SHJ33058.1 Acetyltransferase (GNAT) family protein [Lutispora thermophila DSM 19022]